MEILFDFGLCFNFCIEIHSNKSENHCSVWTDFVRKAINMSKRCKIIDTQIYYFEQKPNICKLYCWETQSKIIKETKSYFIFEYSITVHNIKLTLFSG